MELLLTRTYYETGSNGVLSVDGKRICYTIELPWKDNQRGISCIPEGVYEVATRYSQKFGSHLCLPGVKGRSYILIHSANDALAELRGCIAPVEKLTGPGKGYPSRPAFRRLYDLVKRSLDAEEEVRLVITASA